MGAGRKSEEKEFSYWLTSAIWTGLWERRGKGVGWEVITQCPDRFVGSESREDQSISLGKGVEQWERNGHMVYLSRQGHPG